jgi:hypothetical protein
MVYYYVLIFAMCFPFIFAFFFLGRYLIADRNPFIFNYKKYCEKNGIATIKVKTFFALYSVNPDAWKLYNNYAVYRYDYEIKFETVIDIIKYKCWRKKRENDANRNKTQIELNALSKMWIKDIERYKKTTSELE